LGKVSKIQGVESSKRRRMSLALRKRKRKGNKAEPPRRLAAK